MRMQVLAVTMSEAQISKLTEMAKELGMTRSKLVRILTSSGLENLKSYQPETRLLFVKDIINRNEKELQ